MQRYFLGMFGGIAFAGLAAAAPPPGTDLDGPTHKWFQDQRNIGGQGCCSIADGYIIDEEDWRIKTVGPHTGYEVRIEGKWYSVPDSAIRDPKGGPNPVGKPIVWYVANAFGVVFYCFAPGFGG